MAFFRRRTSPTKAEEKIDDNSSHSNNNSYHDSYHHYHHYDYPSEEEEKGMATTVAVHITTTSTTRTNNARSSQNKVSTQRKVIFFVGLLLPLILVNVMHTNHVVTTRHFSAAATIAAGAAARAKSRSAAKGGRKTAAASTEVREVVVDVGSKSSSSSDEESEDKEAHTRTTRSVLSVVAEEEEEDNESTTTTTKTSWSFRQCTSPEKSVPWPFSLTVNGGDSSSTGNTAETVASTKSKTSGLTCGLPSTQEDSSSSTSLSSLGRYLRERTLPQLQQHGQEECGRLVIYGVAFGTEYVHSLSTIHTKRHLNSQKLLQKHGHCFFMFVLEEDMPSSDTTTQTQQTKNKETTATTMLVGHTWLIPIPRNVLPYDSLRRNAKLLKYHGHFLFPYAQTIIWQDAKFHQRVNVQKLPSDYFQLLVSQQQQHQKQKKANKAAACLTTMRLPLHQNTFGKHYLLTSSSSSSSREAFIETIANNGRVESESSNNNKNGTSGTTIYPPLYYRALYRHHCQTIVEALQRRPDVTDSASSLMQQCRSYLSYIQQQRRRRRRQEQERSESGEMSMSTTTTSVQVSMDDVLLDSAFLIWNYETERCRKFNAELQCTLSDQLQCHSDRDQVSFPFVLAQMGLRMKRKKLGALRAELLDSRRHDLELVAGDDDDNNEDGDDRNPVMVHMTKSACHWYYRSLGDCTVDSLARPSVAILVAGTTDRFLLDSTARHVLQPLVQHQNYTVDFYATLTEESGPAFHSDAEYMKHIVGDPLFHPKQGKQQQQKKLARMQTIMRDVIEGTGAGLRANYIRKHAPSLNSTELIAKRRAARRRHPKEDVDLRFPMLDQRFRTRQRTVNGNRNMLKLFRALQNLWDTKLLPFEDSVGRRYDYIMILRDDAMWLQDLDMAKLSATNPTADAFVQSCDAREPPMLSHEINDFGIIIKREKAAVLGRYFSTLLSSDLEGCHKRVEDSTPQRGCNSEMLLNWILQENNITVQRVPQSLFPFERAVVIRQEDGIARHCFHKFCQSKEAPLPIPKGMVKCQ